MPHSPSQPTLNNKSPSQAPHSKTLAMEWPNFLYSIFCVFAGLTIYQSRYQVKITLKCRPYLLRHFLLTSQV